MATAALPYAASQASGTEELASGQFLQLSKNVVTVDPAGTLRSRPAIAAFQRGTGIGSVIGAYSWQGYCVYVTSDRYIHAITLSDPTATVIELSTSTTSTQLDGPSIPVFAETQGMLVITGGGLPQKWTPSAPSWCRGWAPNLS